MFDNCAPSAITPHTSVWHVHGEINRPTSINLGHEHYAGALGKMRSYTLWDRKNRPKSKNHSAFRQGIIDFDTKDDIKCAWTDVFLRDDIHILGLGLDYSEVDLWWLLVVKERLKWAAFDAITKKLNVGETYYYYADAEAHVKKEEKERNNMLTSLGVKLEPIPLEGNNWNAFYRQAFDKIMARKHA